MTLINMDNLDKTLIDAHNTHTKQIELLNKLIEICKQSKKESIKLRVIVKKMRVAIKNNDKEMLKLLSFDWREAVRRCNRYKF